jgi:hypothetical protein
MVAGAPAGGLLAAVWCETEDDVTLIWQRTGGEYVEFVQVKRNELTQLWSASKICERDSAATAAAVSGASGPTGVSDPDAPRCLAEKSLAHDRCAEPCTFRLITAWELHPDLAVLRLPLDHPYRDDGHEMIEAAVQDIGTKAARHRSRPFVSGNGRHIQDWVRCLVWDVRGRLELVSGQNLVTLERFAESVGAFLALDQRTALYETLLALVKQAADAPWLTEATRKKLPRENVLEFVTREVRKAQNPSLAAGGELLRAELRRANLPPEDVESAWDLRHRYRGERLSPRYLSVDDAEMIEAEVGAVLHDLRAQLVAGELDDSPLEFYARCRAAVLALRDSLPGVAAPPRWLLLGAMYDRVHRGLHGFSRPDLAEVLGDPSSPSGPGSGPPGGARQENAA